MSDFNQSRHIIQELRNRHRTLSESRNRIRQQLQIISDQIEEAAALPAALGQEQNELAVRLTKVERELKTADEQLSAAYEAFRQLGSSQLLVEHLDDALPFLLLPVKVETRFVTIKHITRDFDRSFVLDVSDIQPRVADLAGADIDAPGAVVQIPTLSGLAATGSQSAAQIIEKQVTDGAFVPTSGQWLPRKEDTWELWIRLFPDDIFVHSHEPALTEAEVDAGQSYWNEVWQAEQRFQQAAADQKEQAESDRQAQKLAAWRGLQNSFEAARAKWIIKATRPDNFVGEQTDYSRAPEFADVPVKFSTWTQAPQTFVLPDCFVVRLYSGETYREYTGNPIDYSLLLGLDPGEDEFSDAEAQLELPEKLRWVSDFETAEGMGMALRVDLSEAEFSKGFDRLVVLGLKLTSDQNDAQRLLEELLYNHQYKTEGFSLLPQGTPTNNMENYVSPADGEALEQAAYLKWADGEDPLSKKPHGAHRKDGQHLADALGVNSDLFKWVLNSDGEDIREAMAMNHLLWPATLGYFLQQFLFPLVNEEDLNNTREFFRRFVTGRGQLPCLRVDNQPYGIVPATAFSRWTYPKNDFSDRLFRRFLQVLDKHWEAWVASVIHVGDPSTPGQQFSERLMQMLGLHAGSVEFYVRTLVDPFFPEDVMQMAVDAGMDDEYWEIMRDLEKMGFYFEKFEEPTRIFDMLFSREVRQLDGPLIDRLPLSEKRKLQKLPQTEDHYLDWLAKSDLLKDIRPATVALDSDQGLPLLYLLMRHAIVRETINAAITLLKGAGIISPVAAIDQEREEMQGLGANHEYVLKKAIELKLQHAVANKVHLLYDDLMAADVDKTRIAAFEGGIANTFDFFKTSKYMRQTVADAASKLRRRLIPQPQPAQIAPIIADFVNDVNEAIRAGAESEYESVTAEMVIEPNKWNLLSRSFSQVSGDQTMLEFINAQLASENPPPALQYLAGMRSAFEIIGDLPTARLERLAVEHIDLCSYRLDAWMLGLVHQRLDRQRRHNPKGIYLGAFGYLEDLKPGAVPGLAVRELSPPEWVSFNGSQVKLSNITVPVLNGSALRQAGLDPEALIQSAFVYLGGDPETQLFNDPDSDRIIPQPRTDETGEGFIHTPSPAHANTAAILRSGYATYLQTNLQPSATDPLAVNLSSRRVRRALFYLEGIRNGQELGALLGYQFERSLHAYADRQPVDLDFVSKAAGYLLELRKHFPMQTLTAAEGAGGNENVFSVMDGQALLRKFQNQAGSGHWSQGILTNCPPAHRQLIDVELKQLEESMDALSDLLMAESVYQMAKGSPERSAAALRVLNDGGMMETPEVISTPRRGFTYTQRVGITIGSGGADPRAWDTAAGPRSLLNPHLNQWLSRQLPDPDRICVNIALDDGQRVKWQFGDAGFQPIDLLYLLEQKDFESPDSELCIRIFEQVRRKEKWGPDAQLVIDFQDRQGFGEDQFSLFELLPLLRTLSVILQSARPMLPQDLMLPSQAAREIEDGELDLALIRDPLSQFLADGGDFSLPRLISRLQEASSALADLPGSETVERQAQFDAAFQILLDVSAFGIADAVPRVGRMSTSANQIAIGLQAGGVVELLQDKLDKATVLWQNLSAEATPELELEQLTNIGQVIMGRSSKILPAFKPLDVPQLEKAQARENLLHEMGDFAVEEWLQGVSLVRSAMKSYSRLSMLREAFSSRDQLKTLQILQLPHGDAPWIAGNLPGAELVNGDTLSLALELDDPMAADSFHLGIVVDEWKEFIPEPNTNTGVAFNYNQPDTEAPQTLLLAVTPQETGRWDWDDLVATICETMDMAKKRAVDPDLIKDSPLAHFLPAIVGPINDRDLIPSVDFAKNIRTADESQ